MSADVAGPTPGFLAGVQPIVLVGGKSRRFGRDKLMEPWGGPGCVLVQRPIESLREVFGPRVKLVGDCEPGIAALADGVIEDVHPGIGPVGGVLSALKAWGGPVFVLAGDMPSFAPGVVRRILAVAERGSGWLAVLAATERAHPCAGVYSGAVVQHMGACVAEGRFKLGACVPDGRTILVQVAAGSVVNVNEPGDAR